MADSIAMKNGGARLLFQQGSIHPSHRESIYLYISIFIYSQTHPAAGEVRGRQGLVGIASETLQNEFPCSPESGATGTVPVRAKLLIHKGLN